MEKIYYRIYELILFICSPKREPCKHVDFIILLRRLLYSENLNSPSAQTVSLSLYAMLTKFQKSAYCLQRFPFCTILYIYHYLIFILQFYSYCSCCIQHRKYHYTYVCKYCDPHIGYTKCSKYKTDCLYCQCEDYVFSYYFKCSL